MSAQSIDGDSRRTLLAASAYGPRVASVRVRVTHWLDRMASLGIAANQWTYADLANLGPTQLLRHLAEVAEGERSARRVGDSREETNGTLLLHRELSPLSRGRLELSALRRFARTVFDFDDSLTEPGRARRLMNGPRKYERIIAACDQVVAGNEFLAEWASGFNDAVTIIPSCVDAARYSPKSSFEVRDRPTCVWIGSPTTEAFLWQILDALDAVHQRFDLQVRIISGATSELPPRPYVSRSVWTEETEAHELAQADFGIMPLPDNSFTRGKCSYKLLQYGAAGLPCLGSPVGLNETVLREFGAMAPSTSAEWVDAMIALITSDTQERRDAGARSRAAVEAGYTYDRWLLPWIDAVGLDVRQE